MKTMNFTKMHGLGNDFVIIDQRTQNFDLNAYKIKSISNRNTGIGCDQLITINNYKNEKSPLIEFFNSNGEEVLACGNGSRCVANILMNEMQVKEIELFTKEKKLSCSRISGDLISINMGKPFFEWDKIPLREEVENKNIYFKNGGLKLESPYFVNIGNPHAIFFVNEVKNYSIDIFGPLIETDKLFPEKINVSIAQIKSSDHILVNVWERDSGKTLACGTAACAVAIVAIENKKCENKIQITLPGGDLDVSYSPNENVIMSGLTEVSFQGEFSI